MGIIKQLQTDTYEPENEATTINIEGKMEGDTLSLDRLEIEGTLKDVLHLLAYASASALVEVNDNKATSAFVISLVNAIESIKADEKDN